jgi:hypothetical protein
MSELYAISTVDRREEATRQFRVARSNVVANRTEEDNNGNSGGATGNPSGGKGKRGNPQSGDDSDGIGAAQHHDFDVTV